MRRTARSPVTVFVTLAAILASQAFADERGWYVGAGWGRVDHDLGVGDFDDGSITVPFGEGGSPRLQAKPSGGP